MSLKPVADRLGQLLKKKVLFIEKPLGDEVKKMIDALKEGMLPCLRISDFIRARKRTIPSLANSLPPSVTCM